MNGRIGQQLGNYRLIHRLGSGGFAEVYLGEHVYLKTQAAIKVLPMQLTSDEIENFSKALAKDPKQRFATIHEFALALEEACQRENSENRTLQLVSAGHAAIPLAASLVERERTPPMVATPPQDSSVIWNVPYRRNPFFTGRENILASLHEKLHAGKAMSQIQAISGLGGSGKTQIAIEYAYRHHSDYSVILWLRGDRRDMLREDCTTIASQLSFKGKIDDFIGAVRSWLKTNTNWLLILDNVENLTLLRTFIPSNVRGHVLLTTRTQATGTIAQRIDLCKMARDEAKLFLLRRINKLFQDASLADASHSDIEEANEIAELLGDLPLALDQAGAYIEETGCSLEDYLSLYSTRRAKLLAMRGGIGADHAASVAATFIHSFEKVEQASPTAIDLLRFCAFLDPTAIPEELIRHATEELGTTLQPIASDPLVLDTAIAILRKHSLLHRAAETKLLSLHPLVQAVLKDRMKAQTHQEWVERTVRAVNHAFPDIEEVHMWHRCQLALPHVQACIAMIKKYKLLSPEAVRLLYQAGMYFRIQARYHEAELLLEQAATMQQQLASSTQTETAADLSITFWHHYKPGQYSLIEPPTLFIVRLLLRGKSQWSGVAYVYKA